jgi:hypothetical protein
LPVDLHQCRAGRIVENISINIDFPDSKQGAEASDVTLAIRRRIKP